jgi:hypothetical protein
MPFDAKARDLHRTASMIFNAYEYSAEIGDWPWRYTINRFAEHIFNRLRCIPVPILDEFYVNYFWDWGFYCNHSSCLNGQMLQLGNEYQDLGRC